MNLSTARSLKRAREIGVRKIVGAGRRTLIIQFVTEAMFYSTLAVIFAALLVQWALPAFNTLTGKHIVLPWYEISFWLELIAFALFAGLLAGLYPAWYISSFDPVKAVKGNLKFRLDAVIFRKGLIVFQFTLSILLIVLTIVVGRQVNFIQARNLGFDRENLLYIPIEGSFVENYSAFRNSVLQVKGVTAVSAMTSTPTSIDSWSTSVDWTGKGAGEKPSFAHIVVSHDFVKTIAGKMIVGREFTADYPEDSSSFIINETALQRIGYQDPVGKFLTFGEVKGSIVGVIKDFHFRTLHEPMRPLVIRYMAKNSVTEIYL